MHFGGKTPPVGVLPQAGGVLPQLRGKTPLFLIKKKRIIGDNLEFVELKFIASVS